MDLGARSLFIGVFLLAGFAAGAWAAPIDPDDPPQGLFSDEWVEIYMGDGKVGYGHATFTREGERIHTKSKFALRIGRTEQPVEIELAQNTTESVRGIPIEFGSSLHASAIKTTMTGTIEGGHVTIVTSQYGMEQKQAFAFLEGSLMTWGLFRETLLHGFKPGTRYTLKTYAPDLRLDGPVEATTEVGDWEAFTHQGRSGRGRKVTVTMAAPIGKTEMVSWVNEYGLPLKATIPAPGMGDMILIATDQQTALADFVPPEMFMTSTIKVGRSLDPKSIRRIRYLIRPKVKGPQGDADLNNLPSTGMQEVRPRNDGAVEVVVTRRPPGRRSNGPVAAQPGDMDQFIRGNLMINTEDPKLLALAERAGGDETEPYALADKLRRFVGSYVTNKNLNIGFATASEVCRTREGDCSEHGVLLAALGRINGLPSRVVVGLAYVPSFGGQRDLFGYHLWTQFLIDGAWVDVDAALGETVCSPTRIAFATSSLMHAGLVDLSMPLIRKIGAIDIEILDIE